MRFIVIKQTTDLQALQKTLFTAAQPAAASGAALERVQRMNPHVDLHHLAAGTVLLLPDFPGLDPAQGRAIGEDVFQSLSSEIGNGLATVGERVRAASAALDAERSAMESTINTETVQRMMQADETLANQVTASQAQVDADQKELQAASAAVENLQKGIATELAALGRLLRFSTPQR